jgi:hypothetical protein
MSLFEFTNHLTNNMIVQDLAESKNITVEEAKKIMAGLSFTEYHKLAESLAQSLTEASADIIPPSGRPLSPNTGSQPAATAPTQKKPPVPGIPGKPGTGEEEGVEVRNPKTGKMEVMVPAEQQMQETAELSRMKKLAGIKEDASCGATGAGAIASAPATMGKVKRRPDAVEESPSLEHEVAGRKSVVGATGPQAQPTKKLSANNAARGKPTPNRKNLGFKK